MALRVCACAYLERAQHALHSPAADTQRATDLQYARAALVEAQDGLFQLIPAHAPALFICASLATLDLDQRSGSAGTHAITFGIRANMPFRDWAAMKDQDDTVPKLERASAKTLREYEALKVIQEYANSLREFIKAMLRRRMN